MGKSPLEHECVVGLRGLELRAKHAVAIEPVSREWSAAAILRSYVADLERQRCAEGTGMRTPLERYCPLISGAKGAARSCPAGAIAEVGLRWCGATP